LVHASLGEWDKAFEYFNEGIKKREGWMLQLPRFIKMDFSEMKEDPRVIGIMERIGLPY
jgi:hypothetical protein